MDTRSVVLAGILVACGGSSNDTAAGPGWVPTTIEGPAYHGTCTVARVAGDSGVVTLTLDVSR